VSGAGVADPVFDGRAYAAATAHHRAYDEEVLGPVRWRAGQRVLDVGCGVGDLTRRLLALVAPGGEVRGVDASRSQVGAAREGGAATGLRFDVARAQALDEVVPPRWADVVVTVATLHWVPEQDQPLVHAQLARVLAPAGVLRVDMGGAGQIAAARAVVDEVAAGQGLGPAPWFFPDATALTGLLGGAGLHVREVELVSQRRAVPDGTALEQWLRSQVLPGYLRAPAVDQETAEAFADAAVAACRGRLRRSDGTYDQDYVRARALAVRPA
jgi:trans-aconitate 2-methyltransferase